MTAFDPEAIDESKQDYLGRQDPTTRTDSPMAALDGADALILITEWNEFRRPDFEAIRDVLGSPVIFDGRNIYPRKTLEGLGFTYYGIGT